MASMTAFYGLAGMGICGKNDSIASARTDGRGRAKFGLSAKSLAGVLKL
jgi:hypothetical protein